MADLWGGRFQGEIAKEAFLFNASLPFDVRLWREDIEGSIAHAKMLGKQGILAKEDADAIVKGLEGIREDIEKGALSVDVSSHEDIHSFIEAELTARIGEAGKRLHTGRSRNDQVATDMKLFAKKEYGALKEELTRLLKVLCALMEEHQDTYMPGFTHLQKAQPVTLAHHLGAYFEMFRRDAERLSGILERMDLCPLGAGALAGTTYPIDRQYSAELLGFSGPTRNSMDSVSDRDYLLEGLSAFSILMMHLSRFCEELILWNSNEYGFIEMDDAYSTGSSIMPQKKNPDMAELIRGKTGRVYGDMFALFSAMKGLPLAYNKDMQEDKEGFFDALDTVHASVRIFTDMLKTLRFHKERMAASALQGFSNATDAADYLVTKGVPFRDAHGIVGRMVLQAIEKGIGLEGFSLSELQAFSPCIEEDFYEAISLKVCVERRGSVGAPGSSAMAAEIQENRKYLGL
ncbi:MAG: argininosuccinate lyase [Lachnospiraceae bacterium]|nr:argininosuccinate lyase [Lachnospiraceae bacterium]